MHCGFVHGGDQWVAMVNGFGSDLRVIVCERTFIDGLGIEHGVKLGGGDV